MIEKLQTEIQITPSDFKIRHTDSIMLLGSCFADEIGVRMRDAGFRILKNPTGTLYNPASIAATVHKIASDYRFTVKDVFCKDGIYSSFSHHGSFYDTERDRFIQTSNRMMEEAHDFLLKTDYLVITLGTARIYRNKADGEVVTNCHKFHKDTFQEEVLSVDDCCRELNGILNDIPNKKTRVIFTVSPIRHIRDGLHRNRISKATLLLAVDRICAAHPQCSYFPAYEIQEDELRDYRFYADDLCHPSVTAADYIWKRFIDFSMSDETMELIRETVSLRKTMNHRLLFPESDEGRKFIGKREELIKSFKERHPEVIL